MPPAPMPPPCPARRSTDQQGYRLYREAERDVLGLHGLLPPHVGTLDSQIARRRRALDGMADDFHRYAFLRELQDSNEVLFHALVQADLPRMLPLVYTPTVGEGCERFSEIWRQAARAVPELSQPRQDRRHPRRSRARPGQGDRRQRWRAYPRAGRSGRRRHGHPDRQAGALHRLRGHPSRPRCCRSCSMSAPTMPALRDDPLYVGWRNPRVRGGGLRRVRRSVRRGGGGALAQRAAAMGGFRRAQRRMTCSRAIATGCCSFNDDIQGTAATAVGTLLVGDPPHRRAA